MNILVEAGATKSICIGYNKKNTFFIIKTDGINASYVSKEEIQSVFYGIIDNNNIVTDEVENIRYYGAGCFQLENANKIQQALKEIFSKSNIVVFSDLYAACHALCKNKNGFVGILGTGAASCLYDGEKIVDKAPSLGYLLGDEGSGVFIGKMFVTKYLKDELGSEIAKKFELSFGVSKKKVLEIIYQKPKPQIFFSSIPIFLHEHLENKQIKSLIKDSFHSFFLQHNKYYSIKSHSWFFCGSIAYFFKEILFEVAKKRGVKIESVVKECAMELLTLFSSP